MEKKSCTYNLSSFRNDEFKCKAYLRRRKNDKIYPGINIRGEEKGRRGEEK